MSFINCQTEWLHCNIQLLIVTSYKKKILYQEINERKKLLFNNLQVRKICLPRKSALKILAFAWVLEIQTFSTNEKYTIVLGINKSSFCCSYQLFFFFLIFTIFSVVLYYGYSLYWVSSLEVSIFLENCDKSNQLTLNRSCFQFGGHNSFSNTSLPMTKYQSTEEWWTCYKKGICKVFD